MKNLCRFCILIIVSFCNSDTLIGQCIGGAWDTLYECEGRDELDSFADVIVGAWSEDVDGMNDVIVGAPKGDPRGKTDVGTAFIYHMSPILFADTDSLSASAGGQIRLQFDFPDEEAFRPYTVFASQSLLATDFHGLEIPLEQDSLFQLILAGTMPPFVNGGYGTLNEFGQGQSLVSLAAGALSNWVGSHLHAAVISHDGLTPRVSSFAVNVEILP